MRGRSRYEMPLPPQPTPERAAGRSLYVHAPRGRAGRAIDAATERSSTKPAWAPRRSAANRHCEERSDEAISVSCAFTGARLLRCARNDDVNSGDLKWPTHPSSVRRCRDRAAMARRRRRDRVSRCARGGAARRRPSAARGQRAVQPARAGGAPAGAAAVRAGWCCSTTATALPRKAARRLTALGYDAVHVLDGGVAAWSAAGYPLFPSTNVPSKAFAEIVEIERHTPHVTADRTGPRCAARARSTSCSTAARSRNSTASMCRARCPAPAPSWCTASRTWCPTATRWSSCPAPAAPAASSARNR